MARLRNGASGTGGPEAPEPVPSPGTWAIDRSSTVGFVARQFLVHRVRGRFGSFRATVEMGTQVVGASITGEVDTGSVVTGDPARDEHLRSAEFFDAERWPTMRLVGRIARTAPHGYVADTELTIRDVTRPVAFDVRFRHPAAGGGAVRGGASEGSEGGGASEAGGDDDGPTVAAVALATVSRKDFGLCWNATIETGGVIVADQVDLVIDLVARRLPT